MRRATSTQPGCAAGRRRGPDLVREGRREEQVLALRQQREDLLDVANEAHVEHAVGFVEDQDLDARQIEVRWPTWSSRRPGVATRMSTRLRRALICGLMPTPPNITIEVSGTCFVVGLDRSSTTRREFAGRVRIRQRGRSFGCGCHRSRRCSTGSSEAGSLAGAGLGRGGRSPPVSTSGIAWPGSG